MGILEKMYKLLVHLRKNRRSHYWFSISLTAISRFLTILLVKKLSPFLLHIFDLKSNLPTHNIFLCGCVRVGEATLINSDCRKRVDRFNNNSNNNNEAKPTGSARGGRRPNRSGQPWIGECGPHWPTNLQRLTVAEEASRGAAAMFDLIKVGLARFVWKRRVTWLVS